MKRSLLARLRPAVPVLLVIAGFALLSAAAWLVSTPLGLAVAGVSCIVLEWRVAG